MTRRSLKKFKEAIKEAKSKKAKTLVYSREALAIPNYEKAIELGLDRKTKSMALAWLASSLYKTG
ncbi:MAG: hypothetical protein AAB685_03320 [Patescibacteria group bacterium]